MNTIEQINQKRIEADKAHTEALTKLATSAASAERSDSLAEHLASVARAEGAAAIWKMALSYANKIDDYQMGQEDAVASLLDEVYHPSDGHSGRGNDVLRARFDGIRLAVKNAVRLINAMEVWPIR